MPTRTDRRMLDRRRLLVGAAAGIGAAAGGAPAEARSAAEIDTGVRIALAELFRLRPDFQTLYQRAYGALVFPDIVKVGFILGGAYGEGALLVGGATDSYWSYGSASLGFQAGAQRTRLALFFMAQNELGYFRDGDTFEFGADAELTVIDAGGEVAVDTTKDLKPVIAVAFGRQGLLGGVSLQGGDYNRIVR